MKFARYLYQGRTHAGVVTPAGLVSFTTINRQHGTEYPHDLLELIRTGALPAAAQVNGLPAADWSEVTPLLPYEPPKIWCIGLNYRSHAEDIQAVQPEEPGSFMKPASCMIPPMGQIELPPPDISNEVDAEGELGVIIGRRCRYVPMEQVPSVIFGYTTTLDLTALDVLRRNPRYLTRAKAIDTFFSFGPVIVTADEIADVNALEVLTEHNGAAYSRDYVHNMKHRPYELVRFHSDYMTLYPGDLISTGCPKGARIQPGDRVAAHIEGIGRLEASVRQGVRNSTEATE